MDKVKALFFAQYLGQPVMVYDGSETLRIVMSNDLGGFPNKDYLLLRSIKDLTDEEVINTGQIGFDFFNCIGCEYKLKVIREINKISLAAVSIDEKTCLVKIEIDNPYKLNIHQIDYLRSIGILLPYTHLDENNNPSVKSEAKLIELGWAKYIN